MSKDILDRYPTKESKHYRFEKEERFYCPHCGKEMKLRDKKNWLRRPWTYEDYYNEDDPWLSSSTTVHATETYECEDCKIIELPWCQHGSEWVFPKKYEETITQKQKNYINYLCSTCGGTGGELPFITSLELASKFIGELVPKTHSAKDDRDRRKHVLAALRKSKYDSSCGESTFIQSSTDSVSIIPQIVVEKEKRYGDAYGGTVVKTKDKDDWPDGFKPKFTLNMKDMTVESSYSFKADLLDDTAVTRLSDAIAESKTHAAQIEKVASDAFKSFIPPDRSKRNNGEHYENNKTFYFRDK